MYVAGNIPSSPLRKKRKDNRLILLYKGLKGKARIPTDDLIPKTRHGRNQHSLAFQIPSASKDVYKYRFFPQTIRDWNDLPESLISSSKLSDLDLDLDKYVAGPFSIYATEERAGKNTSPSEKQLS